MRTFVIGDIHGAHRAMVQCFGRSGFDPAKDRLIALGDVCDVYPDVRACIDELLTVRHCDYIIGNHDIWAMDWSTRGAAPEDWTSQGGDQTIASYGGKPMPEAHMDFLNKAHRWLEVDGRVFVHGGFDPKKPLKEQSIRRLCWDREVVSLAYKAAMSGESCKIGTYNEVFVGHTPTLVYGADKPLHFCNIWMLDTGAGWSGRLTIMDVETKEYWQSDPTPELYGGQGRTGRRH